MSLLKEIGAILGFVAFGGLSVLVFLTFQQARHLRRLREWAGRQPERAVAEEERVAEIASEASAAGTAGEPAEPKGPSRLERIRGELAFRSEEVNRRSPVDPRLLLGGLVAIIVAVGILTSGFGLLGTDDPVSAPAVTEEETPIVQPTEVAVFNGTAPVEGGEAVGGIADRASKEIRSLDGYKVGAVDNAIPPSFPLSVVMFEDGAKKDAKPLAADLAEALGEEPEILLMTPEIQAVAGGAKLALIIGLDDAGI